MIVPSDTLKIRIVVPTSHVEAIQHVLGDAGAGQIGNYSHCSFTYPVSGQFLPRDGATPMVGEVGVLQKEKEVLVEAVCSHDIAELVYRAVVAAHPYEEPAIDMIPLLTVK